MNPLRNSTYRRLFTAQVTSLIGTGLTTVALSLLAYDLAGGSAGAVLGIALALKMVAYVAISPIAAAYTRRIDRKSLLIALDLIRASIIVLMPFANSVWQIYLMIFLLNACAAVFTPAFQALIPVVLPDEDQYTQALSYSRIAYELENLVSPMIAALLLTFASYNAFFVGDGITFLVSAALVASTVLPRGASSPIVARTWSRITNGVRRYMRTPQLRALFALDLAVASASALVIVNTVLYVRDELGRGQGDVALALGAAGAGSLVVAFAIPSLLRRFSERRVMLLGAAILPVGLFMASAVSTWWALVAVWFLLGLGLSAVQTPSGRLVQRAVSGDDGSELFAAQFALSHACWLVTYPLAGIVGNLAGLSFAAITLAAVSLVSVLAAARLWPVHT